MQTTANKRHKKAINREHQDDDAVVQQREAEHKQAIERECRDTDAIVHQKDGELARADSQKKQLETQLNRKIGLMREEIQSFKSYTVRK